MVVSSSFKKHIHNKNVYGSCHLNEEIVKINGDWSPSSISKNNWQPKDKGKEDDGLQLEVYEMKDPLNEHLYLSQKALLYMIVHKILMLFSRMGAMRMKSVSMWILKIMSCLMNLWL